MLKQFERNLIYTFSKEKYLRFPAKTPAQKAIKESKIKSGWPDILNDAVVIVENDKVARIREHAIIPEWCDCCWVIEDNLTIPEAREKMYWYAASYGTNHPLTINIIQELQKLEHREGEEWK